jgi:hypothetical protein
METIIRWVVRVVIAILLAIVIKRLYRVFKEVYGFIRDHYILWNVAFGARSDRRKVSHRLRLHAYVCKTVLLDNISINELFSFAKTMVESDITVEQFHQVALQYKFAILCRDKIDGSLRGMCFMDKDHSNPNCTIVKLGLALFTNYYQGGPLLYYIVLYHVFKEMVLHPRTPVYLICKIYSYKSYIGLIKTLSNAYPRYDSKIPDFEKQLLNKFADSIRRPNEEYDPDTFVLKRELSRIKDFVAPISAEELKNPHIRFFAELNPGWRNGHCVFCIARVHWNDIIQVVIKIVKRTLSMNREDKKSKKFRKSFDRQLSFQCPDAVHQVLESYDINEDGIIVPTFTGSEDIYIPDN